MASSLTDQWHRITIDHDPGDPYQAYACERQHLTPTETLAAQAAGRAAAQYQHFEEHVARTLRDLRDGVPPTAMIEVLEGLELAAGDLEQFLGSEPDLCTLPSNLTGQLARKHYYSYSRLEEEDFHRFRLAMVLTELRTVPAFKRLYSFLPHCGSEEALWHLFNDLMGEYESERIGESYARLLTLTRGHFDAVPDCMLRYATFMTLLKGFVKRHDMFEKQWDAARAFKPWKYEPCRHPETESLLLSLISAMEGSREDLLTLYCLARDVSYLAFPIHRLLAEQEPDWPLAEEVLLPFLREPDLTSRVGAAWILMSLGGKESAEALFRLATDWSTVHGLNMEEYRSAYKVLVGHLVTLNASAPSQLALLALSDVTGLIHIDQYLALFPERIREMVAGYLTKEHESDKTSWSEGPRSWPRRPYEFAGLRKTIQLRNDAVELLCRPDSDTICIPELLREVSLLGTEGSDVVPHILRLGTRDDLTNLLRRATLKRIDTSCRDAGLQGFKHALLPLSYWGADLTDAERILDSEAWEAMSNWITSRGLDSLGITLGDVCETLMRRWRPSKNKDTPYNWSRHASFGWYMWKSIRRMQIDNYRRMVRNKESPLDDQVLADCAMASHKNAREDTRIQLVRDALAFLKPAERTVLELKYFRGLSNQECSVLLNVRVNTFAQRLSRAQRSLKTVLVSRLRSDGDTP